MKQDNCEENYLGYIESDISRQIAYDFCVNFRSQLKLKQY